MKLEHNIKHCAPAIHSNGSSKESLVEEWVAFHSALQEAIDMIPDESFHGRNHYVKPVTDDPDAPDQLRRDITSTLLQLLHVAEQMGEHIDCNL